MMRLILIFICLSIVGCSTRQDTITTPQGISTEVILTEADFRQAMTEYLYNGGGPAVSTYDVVLADLNGDNRPEGLIMMNTPFGTWCQLAGCSLFIFENHGNRISLNSRVEPVRGPLFLHKKPNSKWKTIVTRQDGINREARYIELTNTGNGYQAFTLNASDYYGSRPQSGESYFY